jgi:hypothetical protein
MEPKKPIKAKAFSVSEDRLSNVLISRVKITPFFNPNTSKIAAKNYIAIWDTGATHSVISENVVEEQRLIPTGVAEIHGVHGSALRPTYLICVYLPNGVYIDNLQVTDGNLGDADALIGMDIINYGDFAVTNFRGKTTFSFRSPSTEKIDFTKMPKAKTR